MVDLPSHSVARFLRSIFRPGRLSPGGPLFGCPPTELFERAFPALIKSTAMTDSIRAHVEKIIQSGVFKKGARVTRLFEYLVTEELEGRGEHLTPYGIAIDALHANAEFDPATSSTLRVEMHRLRSSLETYYTLRPDSPIIIEFPLGSYRFHVRKNETIPSIGPPAIPVSPQEINSQPSAPPPIAGKAGRGRAMLIASLAFAALLASSLAAVMFHSARTVIAQCPQGWAYVSINAAGLYNGGDYLPARLIRELQKAIAAYEEFNPLIEVDKRCRSSNIYDMIVQSKALPQPSSDRSVWLTLVHRASNEKIWTYSLPPAALDDDALMTAHLSKIAMLLNARHGVLVNDILRRRWPDEDRRAEFICFLDAAEYLSREPAEKEKIFACVENVAASGFQKARALEKLAQLEMMKYWSEDADEEHLRKSAALLEQAGKMQPAGSIHLIEKLRKTRVTRPLNRYAVDDLTDELSERFLYNHDVQYELMTVDGFVYGNWEKALYWAHLQELAGESEQGVNGYILAAAAIVDKDWKSADKHIRETALSMIKLLFETKIAVELGDETRVKEIWKTAGAQFGMDIDAGETLLESRFYHPSINDPLADGLKRARSIIDGGGDPAHLPPPI